MSWLSGALAGAGEQLVGIADNRIARAREDELTAAKLVAEEAREKRLEAFQIRSEGRAAAADTTKRGVMYAESKAHEAEKYALETSEERLRKADEIAKRKATTAAEVSLATEQAKMRAMSTPEMLAIERKMSDAKESSATRASAAATWFKLSNDKKTIGLQDAYTNAQTPEAKTQAKAKLDSHYEAATPKSGKEYASVLKETGDRLKDVERALETNPNDKNLLREREGLVATFNVVQAEMTKGIKAPAAATSGGYEEGTKLKGGDGKIYVVKNGVPVPESEAAPAKKAAGTDNPAPAPAPKPRSGEPVGQKTPEVSGAYASEINGINRAIDQTVYQSQRPNITTEQRIKFSEQISALQNQLDTYKQKTGR